LGLVAWPLIGQLTGCAINDNTIRQGVSQIVGSVFTTVLNLVISTQINKLFNIPPNPFAGLTGFGGFGG
jgi:hypothetical protein